MHRRVPGALLTRTRTDGGTGVIDHHTLQVERPEEIADQIRHALEHIPAER